MASRIFRSSRFSKYAPANSPKKETPPESQTKLLRQTPASTHDRYFMSGALPPSPVSPIPAPSRPPRPSRNITRPKAVDDAMRRRMEGLEARVEQGWEDIDDDDDLVTYAEALTGKNPNHRLNNETPRPVLGSATCKSRLIRIEGEVGAAYDAERRQERRVHEMISGPTEPPLPRRNLDEQPCDSPEPPPIPLRSPLRKQTIRFDTPMRTPLRTVVSQLDHVSESVPVEIMDPRLDDEAASCSPEAEADDDSSGSFQFLDKPDADPFDETNGAEVAREPERPNDDEESQDDNASEAIEQEETFYSPMLRSTHTGLADDIQDIVDNYLDTLEYPECVTPLPTPEANLGNVRRRSVEYQEEWEEEDDRRTSFSSSRSEYLRRQVQKFVHIRRNSATEGIVVPPRPPTFPTTSSASSSATSSTTSAADPSTTSSSNSSSSSSQPHTPPSTWPQLLTLLAIFTTCTTYTLYTLLNHPTGVGYTPHAYAPPDISLDAQEDHSPIPRSIINTTISSAETDSNNAASIYSLELTDEQIDDLCLRDILPAWELEHGAQVEAVFDVAALLKRETWRAVRVPEFGGLSAFVGMVVGTYLALHGLMGWSLERARKKRDEGEGAGWLCEKMHGRLVDSVLGWRKSLAVLVGAGVTALLVAGVVLAALRREVRDH
jgi:hypothetical protein